MIDKNQSSVWILTLFTKSNNYLSISLILATSLPQIRMIFYHGYILLKVICRNQGKWTRRWSLWHFFSYKSANIYASCISVERPSQKKQCSSPIFIALDYRGEGIVKESIIEGEGYKSCVTRKESIMSKKCRKSSKNLCCNSSLINGWWWWWFTEACETTDLRVKLKCVSLMTGRSGLGHSLASQKGCLG